MAARGERCRCIRCREVGDNNKAAATSELVERVYAGNEGREMFFSIESGPKETLLGFVRLRFPPRNRAFLRLPTPNTPEADARAKAAGRGGKGGKNGAIGELNSEGETNGEGRGGSDAKLVTRDESWFAIPFPELVGAALIRELHVYGQLVATSSKQATHQPQHSGIGRRLMQAAEDRAALSGYCKLAVIAGIGTRNYYRKLGYELEGDGGFMIKHLPRSHPKRVERALRLAAFALLAAALLAALLWSLGWQMGWWGAEPEPPPPPLPWHDPKVVGRWLKRAMFRRRRGVRVVT